MNKSLSAALFLSIFCTAVASAAEKKVVLTRGQAIQDCREKLGRSRSDAAMNACTEQKLSTQSQARRR